MKLFVTARFWWYEISSFLAVSVRSSDVCQNKTYFDLSIEIYKTRQNGWFDAIYVRRFVPCRKNKNKHKLLLIFVEHLSGWPVVDSVVVVAAETGRDFFIRFVVGQFGPPDLRPSNEANCFLENQLRSHLHYNLSKQCDVSAFAQMSTKTAK